MVKKFLDVKPSRKIERKSEDAVIAVAKSVKTAVLEQSKNKRIISVLIASCILAAAASSYFFIPPKTKIDIWPRKNNTEETTTLTVGQAKKAGNFIQGEVLEAEKEVSQNFTAHGKKLKSTKARGAMMVYNNYSTVAQTLVATTRFISNEGKLFRTKERVVIPGGYYEGEKLVAGFIDIEVIADQPGEDYNIDPSTFSIPGFVGTSKYTAFYGKSSNPMTGGEKKEVFYATQEDLDNAKNTLTKIARSESDLALRDLIFSGNYVLVQEAISIKADDFKASAELNQELNNFSAQAKSKSGAIVFKEQQLAEFSRNYITQKLPAGEKLIEGSVKTDYSLEATHPEKNELVLKFAVSAQSHTAPEAIAIKEMVKNKNIGEIESILKGFSQIEKAKVEFRPFWVKLSPSDLNSIEVVLHLD